MFERQERGHDLGERAGGSSRSGDLLHRTSPVLRTSGSPSRRAPGADRAGDGRRGWRGGPAAGEDEHQGDTEEQGRRVEDAAAGAGRVGSGVRHRLSILSGLEAAAVASRGPARAGVAQLAEQPPCKRQVGGSIPPAGSIRGGCEELGGTGAPRFAQAAVFALALLACALAVQSVAAARPHIVISSPPPGRSSSGTRGAGRTSSSPAAASIWAAPSASPGALPHRGAVRPRGAVHRDPGGRWRRPGHLRVRSAQMPGSPAPRRESASATST